MREALDNEDVELTRGDVHAGTACLREGAEACQSVIREEMETVRG